MNATASDFRQRKKQLLAQCAADQSLSRAALVHRHLKLLSDLCDDTLKTLWAQAEMPVSCALLAVGGYGRQALFPYSDVDVLVLLPDTLSVENNNFCQWSAKYEIKIPSGMSPLYGNVTYRWTGPTLTHTLVIPETQE